jgi:drug/metabolite transporter (DMT)-like permease
MRRTGRGELYAALAAIGYGSAYVATAFALRSFEPLPIAVDRALLGAIGLAAVIVARRRSARTAASGGVAASRGGAAPPVTSRSVRALHLAIIATCGGPIFLTGLNFAIAGVGPTIASFVAGLYAILAALFAPILLREPLRARALAGFISALVGTAFLAELDLGGGGIEGIAWGLLAAVSFAMFLVLSRKWARADGFDGLAVALATLSTTAVVLGAVVLVTNPATFAPANLAPEALLAIAWLAVVAAAGQALAVASTRLVPASRTAAFLLLNPVSATILSFVLLGERVGPIQVLGGALVLAGMAAATIERPPRR